MPHQSGPLHSRMRSAEPVVQELGIVGFGDLVR